jgi:hypothetical protein
MQRYLSELAWFNFIGQKKKQISKQRYSLEQGKLSAFNVSNNLSQGCLTKNWYVVIALFLKFKVYNNKNTVLHIQAFMAFVARTRRAYRGVVLDRF